jgi:hypothetical protein
MSRPQTALKVLEGRGALKKNPQRYRVRMARAIAAAKSEGIGPPPARWQVPVDAIGGQRFARLRAIWEEFAPAVPASTTMKRALMEVFCETFDSFRIANGSIKPSEKANLIALTKALGQNEGGFGVGKQRASSSGDWEKFA